MAVEAYPSAYCLKMAPVDGFRSSKAAPRTSRQSRGWARLEAKVPAQGTGEGFGKT
jgi:hypothetical protein